jgi:cytochrome b
MTDPTPPAPSPAPPPLVETPVWDGAVRLFHWTVVVLVIVSVTTGLKGGDGLAWHMRSGEALLALVLFRILWGFAGSGNARFGAFLRGPAAVAGYARSLLRPPHQTHATHNPLGGWMVVLLLLALLLQAGTGLFTNDDIFTDGPLVKKVSKDFSDLVSSWHRRFWWALVALVALHVGAVVTYLVAFRDNLVRPMVHGRKSLPPHLADPAAAHASPVRALVLLAASAGAVWWVVTRY